MSFSSYEPLPSPQSLPWHAYANFSRALSAANGASDIPALSVLLSLDASLRACADRAQERLQQVSHDQALLETLWQKKVGTVGHSGGRVERQTPLKNGHMRHHSQYHVDSAAVASGPTQTNVPSTSASHNRQPFHANAITSTYRSIHSLPPIQKKSKVIDSQSTEETIKSAATKRGSPEPPPERDGSRVADELRNGKHSVLIKRKRIFSPEPSPHDHRSSPAELSTPDVSSPLHQSTPTSTPLNTYTNHNHTSLPPKPVIPSTEAAVPKPTFKIKVTNPSRPTLPSKHSDGQLHHPSVLSQPRADKTHKAADAMSGVKPYSTINFSLKNDNETSNEYLLPPPPPHPVFPGLPLHQMDVEQDFSLTKADKNQTAITTYWSYVEPFLQPFGLEDLPLLTFKHPDEESYRIPPLGAHFLTQWKSLDTGTSPPDAVEPPQPSSDVLSNMTLENVLTETSGLGFSSERLLSALLPMTTSADDRPPTQADDSSVRSSSLQKLEAMLRRGASQPLPVNRAKHMASASEIERKVDTDLSFLRGAQEIDKKNDLTACKGEDEIISTLRILQSRLRRITAINGARKEALCARTRDRLAYQEYQAQLSGLDRTIESGWQKKLKMNERAKKKKGQPSAAEGPNVGVAAVAGAGASVVAGPGAGAGAGAVAGVPESAAGREAEREREKEGRQTKVTAETVFAAEQRRALVQQIGVVLDQAEERAPGRFYGLTTEPLFLSDSMIIPDDL